MNEQSNLLRTPEQKPVLEEEIRYNPEDFESLKKENEMLKRELDGQRELLENIRGIFSIASHDVRSSLASLVGFSEVLSEIIDSGEHDNNVIDYVKIINEASHASLRLLEEVSNWIKLNINNENANFDDLNLNNEFIQSIAPFSEVVKKKNINLIDGVDKNLYVYFDGNILRTVIRNLVSNAVKFTPEGGDVTVSSEESLDSVKIYVKDSGAGMSKEKIERLFQNIVKSEAGTNNEKGLGIGLYMCKRLVSKNNGNIEVESEGEGKGSTFIVTIPKDIKDKE